MVHLPVGMDKTIIRMDNPMDLEFFTLIELARLVGKLPLHDVFAM